MPRQLPESRLDLAITAGEKACSNRTLCISTP